MDAKEILNFCLQRGLLIDSEILNMFAKTTDVESVKIILDKIKNNTNQRIITKNVFYENKERINEFFSELPKEKAEKLKIKLGLSIEISREVSRLAENSNPENSDGSLIPGNVKVVSMAQMPGKKLEMGDFVRYFRNRFSEIRNFLQEHPELDNLVSINKISGERQGVSVIGMISEKRVTKNKNILLDVEDLTGKTRILVSQNKKDIYEKAENISLDSVMGFKCSGNREILFANDVIFPEAFVYERKFSPKEEYALFISDVHIGSKLFLEESFLKFTDYLNGKIPNSNLSEIKKIKYLFVVGDLVAGVGVYPNQERDLLIPDIEGQYMKVAELFGKIRKDITIIILPGNHDCVRLMEPQPILDEKYTWPLYELQNAVFTTNPSTINIGSDESFHGFDVLCYHGFSYPYYSNNVPSLIVQNASIDSPDKIMAYLLQNRHLAPSHSSVQYFPSEKDPLVIRKIPDIFVSGHLHKSSLSYYNNVLIISNSCWEDLTPFQEKIGNKPDFCKVPMFNLKTRQVKILDFEGEEHKRKIEAKGLGNNSEKKENK
ncbi:MAG: metallophosphoesterase [Nanoarchaeota archaeon]